MPYKSQKYCAEPYCSNYAEVGVYCRKHSRDYNQRIRDPAVQKHYGRRWEKIRDLYLSKYPLCVECEKAGRLTPATEVHHIVPVTEGGGDDEGNLMAVCKPCHSRFTMGEVRERKSI